jgi:polysaccharide export outer membrane protein
MRQLIYTYVIFGVLFVLTSCSDKQYQALFEQKNLIPDTLSQNNPNIVSYKIKPQDILQVRNLQSLKYIVDDAQAGSTSTSSSGTNSASGQTYQVEEDGSVALPVIGHVPVVGLTRSEAAKKIENLYKQTLLKDPIIELTIVNLKVTILGEVKTQGNFPLIKDKTTLVELIGEAGGLTDKANEKDIKIIHGGGKTAKVTEINLNNIQSIYDANSILQNGDIVYVSENKRAVHNDKLQNFSTVLQPALILLNTILIVFTLVRK